MYKKSYFQGTEEPTPKKKKYKSKKTILIQPRFKEPFYTNYDIYEVKDIGEHSNIGPGVGWHNMNKYKSISEFKNIKRKLMKSKYKNDNFKDTNSNKKKRIHKMKIRANIFNFLIKNAIDFSIDEQINSNPIIGNSGTYDDSVQIGGQLDSYLPLYDFDGRSADKLDFGRDYDYLDKSTIDVDLLMDKYLNSTEISLYGLPDGIDNKEDLDAPSDEQLQYGITDSGNTLYNEI